MNNLEQVPSWFLRPLPLSAVADAQLIGRVEELCQRLPDGIHDLHEALNTVRMYREYDAAANRAAAQVWPLLDQFYTSDTVAIRNSLLAFAAEHLVEEAQARVYRRLIKDPNTHVRRKAQKLLAGANLREVALPLKADGDWDTTGWLRGTTGATLARHLQGIGIQELHGVPPLRNLAALRKLLDIRSERQLGYFLLASDKDNGPYTRFAIPKRGGAEREICAPKSQLRWVQRHLLQHILEKVPAHDAAHGFIAGRSTVTNARKHQGAAVLLKFDLKDFFPTIHYFRVVGLFASLGYVVEDAKFRSADDSWAVAPTLARLCCYTPDPHQWGNAKLPQGAPTSPAISNLVCRRLDARLQGLAERNQGVYTRYADDLTFSFAKTGANLGRFRWWVDQICHQEGFFVNQHKFHVIRDSQRQLVTGIVVNNELRIPRDQRRRFRAILHNCRTHGVESQAKGHARFPAYLRGFASYIHMVHPEEGIELLQEVEALLGPEAEEET